MLAIMVSHLSGTSEKLSLLLESIVDAYLHILILGPDTDWTGQLPPAGKRQPLSPKAPEQTYPATPQPDFQPDQPTVWID